LPGLLLPITHKNVGCKRVLKKFQGNGSLVLRTVSGKERVLTTIYSYDTIFPSEKGGYYVTNDKVIEKHCSAMIFGR
jgi:hypothetical protein